MNKKQLEVFLEFLVFGVIMGVTEDLIALKLATGEPLTLRVLAIVTIVAIPFAALGELIGDRQDLISGRKRDTKN